MFDPADTDIKYLAGVGPKRAELLNKQLGIRSCRDLLYHFPFRYVDRSRIYTIAELTSDMPDIQIKGHFVSFTIHGEGAKRRLQGLFSDGTGIIDVVWFNRVKSISESYHTGIEYILFGKPSIFNGHPNLVHPEIEPAVEESRPRGLQGVYNLTDTLRNRSFTSKTIRTLVHNLFDKIKSLPETLPQSVREKYRLIGLYDALSNIHMPTSLDMLQKAKLRLKFEELFLIQLNILKYAKTRKAEVRGFMFPRIGSHFNRFYSEVLPFSLTEAQKQVIREIRDDMRTGRQMNRLLQGDVGSGKTIVALMSALSMPDSARMACVASSAVWKASGGCMSTSPASTALTA